MGDHDHFMWDGARQDLPHHPQYPLLQPVVPEPLQQPPFAYPQHNLFQNAGVLQFEEGNPWHPVPHQAPAQIRPSDYLQPAGIYGDDDPLALHQLTLQQIDSPKYQDWDESAVELQPMARRSPSSYGPSSLVDWRLMKQTSRAKLDAASSMYKVRQTERSFFLVIMKYFKWVKIAATLLLVFDPMQSGIPASATAVMDTDSQSHAEIASRTFLSLILHQKKLGLALFDESRMELLLTEIAEDEEMSALGSVKLQFLPDVIILPNKCDPKLHEMAKKAIECDDGRELQATIVFTATKNFAPAKDWILALKMSDPTHQSRISGLVDMSGPLSIRAGGGLIEYLERNRIVNQLEEHCEIVLNSIGILPIGKFMQVDIDSLKSLHVFHSEVHPSQMGIGPAKEGLSVFGLLDRSKSVVGKKLLRMWMLRPLMDIAELESRFDAVEYFLQSSFAHLGAGICSALRRVKDVPQVLARIRNIRSSVTDWIALHDSINAFHRILELLSQCEEDPQPKVIVAIKNSVTVDLIQIAFLLREIFDLEESKLYGRLIVRSGVDHILDEKRSGYEGLPDFLTQVATTLLENYFDFDIALNVEFVPQIGYLIVTPNDPTTARVSSLEGIEFMFNTEQYAYWKNPYMRELDETVGDIHGAITDMEAAIAREIEGRVLSLSPQLIAASDAIAELDCLLSFAATAHEQRFVRPVLSNDRNTRIAEGRHPLQELVVERFIPNDILLEPDGPTGGCMHVITGANYSGKSVYLKQIGLITYMAQTGSFVPATQAVIGITDRIFTRIHSRESCTISKSTFMIDLQQISHMIQNFSDRSLLIIDEFGKGTNSNDGIALLGAMIRFFLHNSKGIKCPRILIATHFNELFNVRGVLPVGHEAEELGLRLFHMSIHDEIDSLATQSNIAFLYRIVPGMAEASLGYHCALQAGIPEDIVNRAKSVSRKLHENLSIDPIQIQTNMDCDGIIKLFLDFDIGNGDLHSLLDSIRQKTK